MTTMQRPEQYETRIGQGEEGRMWGDLISVAGHAALAGHVDVNAHLTMRNGWLDYGAYQHVSMHGIGPGGVATLALTNYRNSVCGTRANPGEEGRALEAWELNSRSETLTMAHEVAVHARRLDGPLPPFDVEGNNWSHDIVAVGGTRLAPQLAKTLYAVGGALATGGGMREKQDLFVSLALEFNPIGRIYVGSNPRPETQIELKAANSETGQRTHLQLGYKNFGLIREDEFCVLRGSLRSEDWNRGRGVHITEDTLFQRADEMWIRRREGYGGKGEPATTEQPAQPDAIMDMVHRVLDTVA